MRAFFRHTRVNGGDASTKILLPTVAEVSFINCQDHYWLRTSDYRAVFTDQKGEYRLKWEPGYVGIEFMEEETPGNRQGEMGTGNK